MIENPEPGMKVVDLTLMPGVIESVRADGTFDVRSTWTHPTDGELMLRQQPRHWNVSRDDRSSAHRVYPPDELVSYRGFTIRLTPWNESGEDWQPSVYDDWRDLDHGIVNTNVLTRGEALADAKHCCDVYRDAWSESDYADDDLPTFAPDSDVIRRIEQDRREGQGQERAR